MEQIDTVTINAETVTVPTGFISVRSFYILQSSNKYPLEYITPHNMFETKGGSSSGRPRVYSIEADNETDQFRFGPSPDTSYTGYLSYYKNIEALSEDNDHHHHDVVPNLHYSSDCSIYFHDDDDETVKKAEDRHKNYIENNKEKLKKFTKEELTTGRIELAKLESHLSNEELLEKMKPYNNIQSFFLL